MQLGTFGAILKYAIVIEGSSSLFYEELTKKAPEDKKKALREFVEASKKNKQTLEKTRRMEMQEMILEAIAGIDTVNYETKLDATSFKEGISCALEGEKKFSTFYADSSRKLGFLPNAGRTMEKIGKEREGRIDKIKALL